MSTPTPRVRKHLMDPNNPRPRNPEPMSLTRVQKWVVSTLVATTILHLTAGIVVAAVTAPQRQAQVGLLVVAGVVGMMNVLAPLVIHDRRLLSPWLLLGPLPAAVGACFVV